VGRNDGGEQVDRDSTAFDGAVQQGCDLLFRTQRRQALRLSKQIVEVVRRRLINQFFVSKRRGVQSRHATIVKK